MALYNEILVGRYNRMLQKLFGIKGGPPSPQLSSEISVSLPIFYGAENRYLEGWDRFALVINQPGVAGNRGAIRYRNPTGSNMLLVFEKLAFVNLGVADQPLIQVQGSAVPADLANIYNAGSSGLDNRGRPAPTVIISRDAPAVAPTLAQSIYQTSFLAAGAGTVDVITTDVQEIPLLPGSALQAITNALNVSLVFATMWRERALEEGERA